MPRPKKNPDAPAKPRKKYTPRWRETVEAESTASTKVDTSSAVIDGHEDLQEIWARRVQNPDARVVHPIRIKTPGMTLRWINLSNRGRYQRARFEQGWMPVLQDELIDPREIYGVSYTSEGYVCRGERQTDMLMKMPAAVYKQIEKKRSEMVTRSYDRLKAQMGSAGGSHFKDKYGGSAGDQAEEAASNFVGSIKFGKERASSDDLHE